ncbi:MAG TPA: hypothetical protein VGT24_01755 [Candidatus Acidoferrales bacterium]|nr:hypothetical protein [Candidatus Acidoferrales bacterium]
MFLANMELGYMTTPVGLNLLMTSFPQTRIGGIARRIPGHCAVIRWALITYVPALTTALPRLFGF